MSTGDLRALWSRWAGAPSGRSSDCSGQLAVLEAYRGDLGPAAGAPARSSTRCRAPEPGWPTPPWRWPGSAWTGVTSAEARSPGPGDVSAHPWAAEPWLLVVHEVVQARVLIASGRPDEATRRLVARPVALG